MERGCPYCMRCQLFLYLFLFFFTFHKIPFIWIYNGYTCIHIIIIIIIILKIFCRDFWRREWEKRANEGGEEKVFCLVDHYYLLQVGIYKLKRDFNDNELCPTLHASSCNFITFHSRMGYSWKSYYYCVREDDDEEAYNE